MTDVVRPLTHEELFAETAWLSGLSTHLVRDPGVAADAAQETAIMALRRPPAGDRRPWLARVARNFVRQRFRAETRRARRETRAPSPTAAPDPAELVADAEIHRLLADVVATLAEPSRTAVVLRYYDGLSPTEIAQRLDLPPGTVRVRLHRALARLRERLDERHGGDRKRWLALVAPLALPRSAPPGTGSTGGGARPASAAKGRSSPARAGRPLVRRVATFAAGALLAAGIVGPVVVAVTTPTDDATPTASVPTPSAADANSVMSNWKPVPAPQTDDAAGAEAAPRRTGAVRGRVLLADGNPASAAEILALRRAPLYATGDCEQIGDTIEADDGGRFELPEVAAGDEIVVFAAKSGFATATATAKIESFPAELTVRFEEGGTLTGTVLDRDGAPMADVEVRLRPADRMAHTVDSSDWRPWSENGAWGFFAAKTRTGPGGRYCFEGLPVPREGRRDPRVAVVRDRWCSEPATVAAVGETVVRDVRVGEIEWRDAPRPKAPRVPHRRVRGRVVDDRGAPIVGARAVYVASDDLSLHKALARTDEDGRFEADLGERFRFQAQRLEVRVGAKGRREWRGPPVEGELTVRLEAPDHPPAPGRVRGVATDAAGAPLTGAVLVFATDELFDVRRQFTWADERGAFVLEGLPPGVWQLSLDEWDDEGREVAVSERAEAAVELRTSRDTSVRVAWSGGDAERLALLRAKAETLSALADRSDESAASRTELRRAREQIAELEAARSASSPGREVRVAVRVGDGVAVVRAERPGLMWRSEAQGGVARFPSLGVGEWTFVLERPGEDDVETKAEIVAGDGPQGVVFDAR